MQLLDNKVFAIIVDMWNFPIVTYDGNNITIGTLTVGAFSLFVGISLSRNLSKKISQKFFNRFIEEKSNLHVVESVTFYVCLIFFTLFAMKLANVPLTIFTVIGGALAIGFGFGSQNIVNNFISGIILMIERPVKVGDFIEVDGILGNIEDIGMRSTRILEINNTHIIVPNSSFLEKNVRNWTHGDNYVRSTISVGVSYGSDTRKVESLLTQAAKERPECLKNKPVSVIFKNFGDSSLEFDLNFYISLRNLTDLPYIESTLRFRIDELFRENQVTIPYPQRDLHVPGKINVELVSNDG